jgi:hypothetical protein
MASKKQNAGMANVRRAIRLRTALPRERYPLGRPLDLRHGAGLIRLAPEADRSGEGAPLTLDEWIAVDDMYAGARCFHRALARLRADHPDAPLDRLKAELWSLIEGRNGDDRP